MVCVLLPCFVRFSGGRIGLDGRAAATSSQVLLLLLLLLLLLAGATALLLYWLCRLPGSGGIS
jgi:hypothetical protein